MRGFFGDEITERLMIPYARKLWTAAQVQSVQPLIRELQPRLNAYLKSIGPKSSANDQ